MVNSAHFATNHVWSKDAYPLFSLPLFSANWSDKVPVVGSPSHETLWAIVTVGFQFVQGVCLWMSCAVWKCKNQIEQWMCIHIADINLWKKCLVILLHFMQTCPALPKHQLAYIPNANAGWDTVLMAACIPRAYSTRWVFSKLFCPSMVQLMGYATCKIRSATRMHMPTS